MAINFSLRLWFFDSGSFTLVAAYALTFSGNRAYRLANETHRRRAASVDHPALRPDHQPAPYRVSAF
jgi:hypothetical protein